MKMGQQQGKNQRMLWIEQKMQRVWHLALIAAANSQQAVGDVAVSWYYLNPKLVGFILCGSCPRDAEQQSTCTAKAGGDRLIDSP